MRYREIYADLFDLGETHELIHCVSADFALGAGIARRFAKLGVAEELKKSYDGLTEWSLYHGHAYQTGHIWSLVTKERYWHKPTYTTLRTALENLKEQLLILPVSEIAMPQIGCGLDRLQWGRVSAIIQDVFSDTDIDITVCILPQKDGGN